VDDLLLWLKEAATTLLFLITQYANF